MCVPGGEKRLAICLAIPTRDRQTDGRTERSRHLHALRCSNNPYSALLLVIWDRAATQKSVISVVTVKQTCMSVTGVQYKQTDIALYT